ncbi:tetratricopeptide repeat protein [Ferrovum sp. PN-J185]|uniref:tetratricopeptide repeat protein n=1 Tax=Ferrovum sp. PN-J185 TaxID=1356306 RepID=UPI000795945C|nr:tetratricopeptide repeat protein [Ferrovum sp. PN-J185]KXW56971.1 TPR repeat-containing protein YrrB [Ferrovum sp. PN-J185]MCC6069156.1 tetratricopeptide repeat protein [Ferrovum sp. PN-J185]
MEQNFKQAYELHQSGHFIDAINAYLSILKNNPLDDNLLYLLGTAFNQVNDLSRSVEYLKKSLSINPNNAAAYNNLGVAYYAQKQFYNALNSYDKAITIKSNYFEAYDNRGNTLKDLKRLDEALASYDKAIELKPNYVEAIFHRANTLKLLNRLEEAIISYNKVIALQPDYIIAHYNCGNIFREIGRFEEALTYYAKTIEYKPDYADAYNNMGVVLSSLNCNEEALNNFNKAIELKPKNLDPYKNKGNLLINLNRLDEALAHYDEIIKLKPNRAELHNNRGVVLARLKRFKEAIIDYQKAINYKPNFSSAYNNLGTVYQDINREKEALHNFDKAIEFKRDYIDAYFNKGVLFHKNLIFDNALENYNNIINIKPNTIKANWNKSLLLLLYGYYLQGWELYEWRFQKDELKANYYTFPKEKINWKGKENINGKTILIYHEQGFGDTIQFCRYLPLVKELGANINFLVPSSLAPVIATLDCPMTVIIKGKPIPNFDAYCPLMSLPHVFKTTIETIPSKNPYLYSIKSKTKYWEDKNNNKRLKVGLVWSGSKLNNNDIKRSIPFNRLTPLLKLPIEWHSLQKEYRESDIELLKQYPEIHQHQHELKDFSDTAALIESLDLIICVDTSVAHLAGAMGKPVWLMITYFPDFRWLLNRYDSPWYPTVRLFRQPKHDDWESVVSLIRLELTNKLKSVKG